MSRPKGPQSKVKGPWGKTQGEDQGELNSPRQRGSVPDRDRQTEAG